jgi:hypothetical protein
MTINHDNPKKIHPYNSDDRQLLVNLLHEYSDKLVAMSREIVRARVKTSSNRWATKMPLFWLLFCISSSLLFWVYLLSLDNSDSLPNESRNFIVKMIYFWNYFPVGFIINVSLTSVLLFGIIFSFLNGLFQYNIISSHNDDRDSLLLMDTKIEDTLKKKDAQMLASRLESTMRLTVEIADQVESNLARKLELDLRIADASYALEYYYSVIGLQPKSTSKPQKSIFSVFTFKIKNFFNSLTKLIFK